MTYTTRRYRRPRRRQSVLADFATDLERLLGGSSEESVCLDQANASAKPIDAKIDDLVKNWNPTGFYTTSDLRTIVSATMAVVAQGYDALTQAAAEPNASSDSITRATNDLARAGERSLDYLSAATTADQQGMTAVNAPGFKRWVTDTLASASSALVTASVIGCLRPWWVTALSKFQSAFDVVWSVAKRVVGAVLKLGDVALKVPDQLDDLLTILMWGLGLGGAAYLIHHVSKHATGEGLL